MAIAGTLTYKTELDTSGVKKAGSTVKSIIAGLGITKLISSAMNTIKASTDDAIKRLDTLNNFPKVMSNLGISADESSKSITKMSDKLAGLPTTLDQGASAVQRFTSKNNDVEKSTDIFLALNNAILAGGAPTEQQASALEQLSQAYAKGKPDMMEWRSAMSVMPAQLNQVAEAMGFGANGADALGEALRNGDVTMDEFMDTIVELNETGVNGFQNFEEQARNSTSGIGTAITVAKTQIVKGVTDIIDALNKKFEDTSFGSLSGFISNAGKKAKEALDMVAKLISGEISFKQFTDMGIQSITSFLIGINENIPQVITTISSMLTDLMNSLIENLPLLINVGMQIISNLVIGIAQQLPTLIPKALETVITIVMALLDNIDLIIDAGIELILGLAEGLINALPMLLDKAPVIIDKLIQAIFRLIPKIIELGWKLVIKLSDGLVQAIPKLVAIAPKLINSLLNGISSLKSGMVNAGVNTLKYIIDGLKSMINKIPGIGGDIVRGLWSGISGGVGWIKDKISGWVGDVTSFMKKMFKIGSPSKLMADEIGQWLPKGVAVGIDANTDSVENAVDDMYKEMNNAIQTENAKLNLGAMSNGIYDRSLRAVSMNASFNGTIPVQLELDGEKIYDNQQKISLRKSIQYGGAK